jgi:hypothetical protein
MAVTSTRPPRAKKESSERTLRVEPTTQIRSTSIQTSPIQANAVRSLALDAGNYDLKYWEGIGSPRAIRSMRFQVPQGRDPVRFSESSPLIELPGGLRYHFGMQAYKYRHQQQTVVENFILALSLCPIAVMCVSFGLIFSFPRRTRFAMVNG